MTPSPGALARRDAKTVVANIDWGSGLSFERDPDRTFDLSTYI